MEALTYPNQLKKKQMKANRALSASEIALKIEELLSSVRNCLVSQQKTLPFVKCPYIFDPLTLKYELNRQESNMIILNCSTLKVVLRLVEILTICKKLILEGRVITKRSLYYQLAKYYQFYGSVDADIKILTDTLKLKRDQLNIVASNRLLIFTSGNWELRIETQKNVSSILEEENEIEEEFQGQSQRLNSQMESATLIEQSQILAVTPGNILKMPNCQGLRVLSPLFQSHQQSSNQTLKTNVLIVQKESILQLLSQSEYLANCAENWLILSSKGYPDQLTKYFVESFLEAYTSNSSQSEPKGYVEVFYLGDYDIYGVEIMLQYALGKDHYNGIWRNIKWLSQLSETLEDILTPQQLNDFKKNECSEMKAQDLKKAKHVLSNKFDFSHFEELKNEPQVRVKFLQKMFNFQRVIEKMVENRFNCELQSYFKCYSDPMNLIRTMIQKGMYI